MNKIGIDLTWVRHGKVGGTESNTRNILDGISKINDLNGIKFVLFVTEDNADSFEKYEKIDCFELYVCSVKSANPIKRVLWQNLKFGKILKKFEIKVLFEPVYGKPFWGMKGIRVITTIHDLQALHFPEYFSKARCLWMNLSWKSAVKTSYKVIAITNYVKEDIIKNYKISPQKIEVIYDAINADSKSAESESALSSYGAEVDNYYFTVAYFSPHKNLKTLILVLKELKRRKSNMFKKLVICGANSGNTREKLEAFIKENDLDEDIIILPYISSELRNRFYMNCSAFLFPSIFEGFGMPPIEAMSYGKLCITTRCACIPEVTGNMASYVDDPTDIDMWIDKIENQDKIPKSSDVEKLLSKYNNVKIAKEYIHQFEIALTEKS